MEVGDRDLGAAKLGHQLGRHHVELAVVVVWVTGQEHAEAVSDGDARRDDQEGVGEARILRIGELVERLPGDQHRHDDGLAGAGRHLEGDAIERRAGVLGGPLEVVLQPGVAVLPGHLGEVDRRLERLDLAEEEASLPALVRPVVQQAARGRGHADVAALAPARDPLADAVDEGVLLDAVLDPLGLEEVGLAALLLGPGNRDEVLARPAPDDDFVGDAVFTEPEVALRLLERRVDDRVLDDDLWH